MNRPVSTAMTPPSDTSKAPHGDPLLRLTDVGVRFGGVVALSGIATDVVRGGITAIVGPNGAGKTTLLNAISGFSARQLDGSLLLDRTEISGRKPHQIARLGVGRAFQNPQIIDTYTVLENLLCGAHMTLHYRSLDQLWRFRRVAAEERQAISRAQQVLEFTGLSALANERGGSLPYGQRKLIDIARALMAEPRLLLLDEPSSGLDAAERETVRVMLDSINARGTTTVMMVEHHMDLVRATAQRTLGLHAGRLLADGPTDEVLDSEAFRQAVVGGKDENPASQPDPDLPAGSTREVVR